MTPSQLAAPSARFEPPSAEACEALLRDHVIAVWFPRSLDPEHGGFRCDFDRRWHPCGPHDKLLEFQARQTLVAAEALAVFPDDERLRQAVATGFRYLREAMWDGETGGWYHRLDRTGRPLTAMAKHAHGTAYAIKACVAVHRVTADPAALDLAREGFEWLEAHAHDGRHGGYFGFLTRDGMVIRDGAQIGWTAATDTIDTPLGLKDANVQLDLIETFAYLEQVWSQPRVGERLAELVRLFCERMVIPSGAVHFLFREDWTPLPHLTRFGYGLQVVPRLLAGRSAGEPGSTVPTVARAVVGHALKQAWDPRYGGFYFAGPAVAPQMLEGHSLVVRRKLWWVQVEGLTALLTMSQLDPETPEYRDRFEAQWGYIQRYLIDHRYGGVFSVGLDGLPAWRRLAGKAPGAFTRKGSVWKDASHEGRTWLRCREALRAASATGWR
jgi:mannobiose 2-epimerase